VEAREITISSRRLASDMMMSSTIPSAKYSFFGSPPRFQNGSTAIDGSVVSSVESGTARAGVGGSSA